MAGGDGSCETGMTGIDAGSRTAIPKSVNFHVFVRAEYKTSISLPKKGDILF